MPEPTFREILLMARPLIASGYEEYLCLAAGRALRRLPGHSGTVDRFDREIRRRIGGCFAFDTWWRRQNCPPLDYWEFRATKGFNERDYRDFMRARRLEWIDSMLAEVAV